MVYFKIIWNEIKIQLLRWMVPKLKISEKIGVLKKYSQEMPNFHFCSTYLQVDKKKGFVLNVFKISEH